MKWECEEPPPVAVKLLCAFVDCAELIAKIATVAFKMKSWQGVFQHMKIKDTMIYYTHSKFAESKMCVIKWLIILPSALQEEKPARSPLRLPALLPRQKILKFLRARSGFHAASAISTVTNAQTVVRGTLKWLSWAKIAIRSW